MYTCATTIFTKIINGILAQIDTLSNFNITQGVSSFRSLTPFRSLYKTRIVFEQVKGTISMYVLAHCKGRQYLTKKYADHKISLSIAFNIALPRAHPTESHDLFNYNSRIKSIIRTPSVVVGARKFTCSRNLGSLWGPYNGLDPNSLAKKLVYTCSVASLATAHHRSRLN